MKHISLTIAAILAATGAAAGDDDWKRIAPAGIPGPAGPAGAPGVVDYSRVDASISASAAMGALELVQPNVGGWSWAAGVGGSGDTGIAAGAAYGLSDGLFGYAKAGVSGGREAYFVGVGGRF